MKNKIVVIGDVILDSYIIGSSNRLSPEAPIPVVKYEKEFFRLGGCLNVFNNLKNLKQSAHVIGVTGNDNSRKEVINLLGGKNFEGLIIDEDRPTIIKQRIMIGNQQVVRVDQEVTSDIDEETQNKIFRHLVKYHSSNDIEIIILSDYNKGVLNQDLCKKIIEYSIKNNIKVLVDPKGNDFSKYKGSYLITPNYKEAVEITNSKFYNENYIEISNYIKNQFSIKNVLITLSEKGVFLNHNHKNYKYKSNVKDVSDVSGAGDTVMATIAYCLNIGKTLPKSCEVANYAGGVVVSKAGTASIFISDIEFLLKNELDFKDSNSKKIIFTNGCFDILHIGHLKILSEAKKLGDYLIVGLNSDSSVKNLKGNNRPINQQEIRKEMLDSIKFVDEVIIFSEKTPLKLIKKIRPNILVKGGDYKIDEIVGYKEVIESGGEVKIIPLVNGFSTTNIISKLKN